MRHSYKLTLRAKGIRPIPRYEVLRSHHADLEGEHIVLNTRAVEWKPA